MTDSMPNILKFDRIEVDASTLPIGEMSMDDFYALTVEEQLELGNPIQEAFRPSVNEIFNANRGVDWLLVGVPSGDVLASGTSSEIPATMEEVKVLAREAIKNSVPFTFTRPTHSSTA